MLEAKELSVTQYILSQENNLYIFLQVVFLLFISELFILLFIGKKMPRIKASQSKMSTNVKSLSSNQLQFI